MVDDVPGGFVVDDAPGGFVVDDGSGGFLVDDTAGGFIPEDNAGGFSLDDEVDIANYSLGGSTTGLGASGTHSPSSESDNADNNSAGHAKFITVDRIPGALVSLGLPPDDPDILRVFENASSGWASDDPSRRRQQDVGDVAHEKRVSKRDWRAVCTVLLVDAPAEDHTTSGPSHVREDIDERSDIYLTSDDDELDDDSSAFDEDEDDDNYGRSSRKSSRKVRTDRDDEDNEEPPLDEYQLAETRRAFGLFLDAVQDSSSSARPLQDRRIGIREVEGAAKLLKEKLTAEDVSGYISAMDLHSLCCADQILEMLEMFSTSPDKTLGMADFERMMRATHLV